jgi:hypothetical protein
VTDAFSAGMARLAFTLTMNMNVVENNGPSRQSPSWSKVLWKYIPGTDSRQQNSTIQERKPWKLLKMRWKEISKSSYYTYQDDMSISSFAEHLPNIVAKNFHQLNPLAVGPMTVIWNGTWFYSDQTTTDRSFSCWTELLIINLLSFLSTHVRKYARHEH